MQLVHIINSLCFLTSTFAPRLVRLMLFCTEEQATGSSSSQQLLKGHIRQHNSYLCLTAKSSHPRPGRAGSMLHIPNRWTSPRRFGTETKINKATQSLRRYHLINHTHLCKRIRRTLSLWCSNPNWKPVHPTRTVLVWGRVGERCVSVSICFVVTVPKNHVYLPLHISPANIMGLCKTDGHSGDWSSNFNRPCRIHLEICLLCASINKYSWNFIPASTCKIGKMLCEL